MHSFELPAFSELDDSTRRILSVPRLLDPLLSSRMTQLKNSGCQDCHHKPYLTSPETKPRPRPTTSPSYPGSTYTGRDAEWKWRQSGRYKWNDPRQSETIGEYGTDIASAFTRLQQPGSGCDNSQWHRFRMSTSGATESSPSGTRTPSRTSKQGYSVRSVRDAVIVAIRVRPMTEREIAAGLERVVSVDDVSTISVVDPVAFAAALSLEGDGKEQVESSMWAKLFHFDRCFGANFGDIYGNDPGDRQARQEEIFEDIGTAVVDQALSGFNATVFAYGQTGSGKSYTMMGSGRALDDSVPTGDHGLIPRICAGLFERIDEVTYKCYPFEIFRE